MAVRLGNNKWNYNESGLASADLNDTFDAIRIMKKTYTNTQERIFPSGLSATGTVYIELDNIDLDVDVGILNSEIVLWMDFSADVMISPADSSDWVRMILYSDPGSLYNYFKARFWKYPSNITFSSYATITDKNIVPFIFKDMSSSTVEPSSYSLLTTRTDGTQYAMTMEKLSGNYNVRLGIVFYDYIGSQSSFYIKNLNIDFYVVDKQYA